MSLLSRIVGDPTVGSLRDRRKAALRGEGFAWVPDLRSFDKLREVGDSLYLGFTLFLRAMLMFWLVEALNGRLIGPKTWDRSVKIFRSRLGNLGIVTDCYGFMCDELCYKSCIDVYEAGNDHEIRLHKVNR